jgi:eukaryotic-like serine/threonine-protein kinase
MEPNSIDRIFCDVAQIASPVERQAYLEKACGGNARLRQKVEKLLDVRSQAENYLESPPPALHATVDEPVTQERPGTMIGPYKLLQQIGEGGMGTVFMAEQTRPVQRKVAVKVIKPGMDSHQVIARFEAERQALALMDHPNIAKVLDAGATDSGRPYFVMELVKGVPLTKYCDEHRLTPKERLGLFVDVCSAVQHAHQKGIIHRDLKPSNVLVALYDGKPVPKVIDFGIAKATGPKLTERTLFTEFGAVVGTLEYMSPEQAELNQLDIDTRSDVYSLGVLLYELLTGTTPLESKRLKTAALLESLRLIREEEPPKPSTRLSTTDELPSIAANRGLEPRKLSGLVRGELDWIVMKCLEKDRDRRYETANGLARDLQRYLHDEPVQAGPPSARYRLRKFVRRNRRALAAVAVLGVALLAALGAVAASLASAAQDRRERLALAEAADRERRDRSAAAEREVTLALKEAGALQAQKKWPEALEAAKRAQGLLAEDSSEELRGRVSEVLKDVNMVLALEEIRLPKAAGGRREGDYFHNAAADAAYARAFRDYGIDVETLEPVQAAGLVRARPICLELTVALDHWAYFPARTPQGEGKADDARWKRLVAVARAADPDGWRNQVRDALQHGKTAILIELADSPRIGDLPLQTLSLLGNALDHAGAFQQAVTVLRRAQQRHPDDYQINFQLAWSLDHGPRAPLDEVVRFYTVARALRPRNVGVHLYLGKNLREMGKRDEAIAVYCKALELDPENGAAFDGLDRAFQGAGQLGTVLPREQMLAKLKEELGPDHPATLRCMNALAHTYLGSGRQDEALTLFEEALAKMRKHLGPDHSRTLDCMGNLAGAYLEAGMLDRAEPLLRECLAIRTKHMPDDWLTFNTRSMLGAALAGQKKYTDAEPLLVEGYEGMKQREAKIPTEGKIRLMEALESLVALYEATAQKDKAAAWRKKLEQHKADLKKPKP